MSFYVHSKLSEKDNCVFSYLCGDCRYIRRMLVKHQFTDWSVKLSLFVDSISSDVNFEMRQEGDDNIR